MIVLSIQIKQSKLLNNYYTNEKGGEKMSVLRSIRRNIARTVAIENNLKPNKKYKVKDGIVKSGVSIAYQKLYK